MLKYISFLALLLCSFKTFAHQPNLSSTIISEEGAGNWVLQVTSAFAAFEYEVRSSFGEDAYESPEEFNKLAIDHIRKNIVLYANGNQKIELKKAALRLGHETTVAFELSDFPATLTSLSITNSSFNEIPNNQSAMMIAKKDHKRAHFMLNKVNKHQINLKIGDSEITLAPKSTLASVSNSFWAWSGMIVTFAGLLGFIAIKKTEREVQAVPLTSENSA